VTEDWPIAGLRVWVAGLELRLPDAADLAALAALAEAGVHDPAVQPFSVAWTDRRPGRAGTFGPAVPLVMPGVVEPGQVDAEPGRRP